MRTATGTGLLVIALVVLVALPGGSLARAAPPVAPPSPAQSLVTDALSIPSGSASHPLDGATRVGVMLTLQCTRTRGGSRPCFKRSRTRRPPTTGTS